MEKLSLFLNDVIHAAVEQNKSEDKVTFVPMKAHFS
jgi:hypothetical protein